MATLSREAMRTLPPPPMPKPKMITCTEARIAYYGADAETLLETLDKRIRENSKQGFSSCHLSDQDVRGLNAFAKGGEHPVLAEVRERLIGLGFRVTLQAEGGIDTRFGGPASPARFNVSWA
jgi:hypothetical protein